MRTLSTKKGREELLNYEFNRLETKGYKREDYKDIVIWTKTEENKHYLTVFKGTSTNPIKNYYYTQLYRMEQSIKDSKECAARRINYKAEQKAKLGFKTGSAACSAAIKNELKNLYPHIKFSVTSEVFAGGDAVRINWTDGITNDEISNITSKYQSGHFDGMTDMYEYSNRNADLPQAKYITTSRNQSEETKSKLKELLTPIFEVDKWNCHNIENLVYRLFVKTSFPKNGVIKGLEKTGETCGLCDINVFYFVSFEGEEKPEGELIDWDTIFDEPAPEKTDSDIEIIDYSEKAIVLIGEGTKRIKNELKAIGGRFNFRLSVGAGWVLPKSKREQVLQLI